MSFKKVLLVKPWGRHGLSFAFDIIPTGLEYIAANIEDVVDEVNIIDLEMDKRPFLKTLDKYLDDLRPDLVGVSMSSTEHKEGLEISQRAKARGIKTVLGGFHPTAIPDELLTHPEVDFVVRGEGEVTMHELVTKGSADGVDGTSYRDGDEVVHNPDRAVIKDLDSIPLPARHLRRYKYYLALARGREYDVITTSRGCWGKCNFCCEPSMSHSRQRFRKPETVFDEILGIHKFHKGKPLLIEITDPHFMGKPRMVEKLCDMLAERDMDIEYIAKVRPDTMAKFPDIVRKMVSVGIAHFEMGIESPNKKDLKYTSKGLKAEVHMKAVQNIRKWGGNPGGSFVLGLPDHTEEEILQFPEYAKKIGLLTSAFAIVTPYPGTKFYEQIDSQGLIFETSWNRFDEMHSVFKTKYLTSERLEELASICMAKFWTEDTFLERERVHQIRIPSKTALAEYVERRLYDLDWGSGSMYQLQEGNFKRHILRLVEASPNPAVKRYTERVGIHNILEMSKFLAILGDQTIQMTLRDQGRVLTSWVMKTTKDAVEYIKVIPGEMEGCTIHFNMDLDDLIPDGYNGSEGQKTRNMFGTLKTVLRALASNKGFRRWINFFKLAIASSAEFLRHLRTKNGSKSKRRASKES